MTAVSCFYSDKSPAILLTHSCVHWFDLYIVLLYITLAAEHRGETTTWTYRLWRGTFSAMLFLGLFVVHTQSYTVRSFMKNCTAMNSVFLDIIYCFRWMDFLSWLHPFPIGWENLQWMYLTYWWQPTSTVCYSWACFHPSVRWLFWYCEKLISSYTIIALFEAFLNPVKGL